MESLRKGGGHFSKGSYSRLSADSPLAAARNDRQGNPKESGKRKELSNFVTPNQSLKMSSTVIQDIIKQIDQMVTAQLNEIIHAKEFQRLEASWRGLHYLAMNSETGIRRVNSACSMSPKRICSRTLRMPPELINPACSTRCMETEFKTRGGLPFRSPDTGIMNSRTILRTLLFSIRDCLRCCRGSCTLRSLRLPPQSLGLDHFADIIQIRDPLKTFEKVEDIKWRFFRDSEDSRYVGLTFPPDSDTGFPMAATRSLLNRSNLRKTSMARTIQNISGAVRPMPMELASARRLIFIVGL